MRWPEDYSGATTDAHLVELWLNGRPESTQVVYRRTAKKFLEWLTVKDSAIQKATVADLVAWSDTIEGVPATKARVVGTIKSLLTFAHRTGYTVFNVGRALLCPKVPSNLHKRIVDEETIQDILKAAASDRDKAIVYLFYGSGIRSSELCNLTFGDIKGDLITVLGKGTKNRTILVPAKVMKLVAKLRKKGDKDETPVFRSYRGRAFTAITMWKVVRTISDEAGFSLSPHWFRHAHASHSLDHGAPVHLVQHCLGHANVSSTSCYLHVKPRTGAGSFLRTL